jgi:acetyltransferase-like isoleucine patch superfamily enzyme
MPWFLKRYFLEKIYDFKLNPSAYIGLSWIFPKYLEMGEHAKIGHLNVAINLDEIIMHKSCSIGRNNWITGFPSLKYKQSLHFSHQLERKSILLMKEGSAITVLHHIDCTNMISIGRFTTVAGYNSQFLTHSINVYENIQDSKPIDIGSFCLIGTNCIILGGAKLPDFSVLGAKSLLNKILEETYFLYAGVPAKGIKIIAKDAKYFNRVTPFVY